MNKIQRIAKIKKMVYVHGSVNINYLVNKLGWSTATCYRMIKDIKVLYDDIDFHNSEFILVRTSGLKRKYNHKLRIDMFEFVKMINDGSPVKDVTDRFVISASTYHLYKRQMGFR